MMATNPINKRLWNGPLPFDEKIKELRDAGEYHKICRWCGKPVPAGRRTWCSNKCVDEYQMVSDWNYVRKKVFERDGGICALCGIDCSAVKAAAREMLTKIKSIQGYYRSPKIASSLMGLHNGFDLFHKFLKENKIYLNRSMWEVDHIIPVVEGGGLCGLDNLRTLCIWCHANETKKLRSRMKRKEL